MLLLIYGCHDLTSKAWQGREFGAFRWVQGCNHRKSSSKAFDRTCPVKDGLGRTESCHHSRHSCAPVVRCWPRPSAQLITKGRLCLLSSTTQPNCGCVLSMARAAKQGFTLGGSQGTQRSEGKGHGHVLNIYFNY